MSDWSHTLSSTTSESKSSSSQLAADPLIAHRRTQSPDRSSLPRAAKSASVPVIEIDSDSHEDVVVPSDDERKTKRRKYTKAAPKKVSKISEEDVSPDEDDKERRLKLRRIKNRDCAAASRARKKQREKDLEERVARLEKENRQLRAELAGLKSLFETPQ